MVGDIIVTWVVSLLLALMGVLSLIMMQKRKGAGFKVARAYLMAYILGAIILGVYGTEYVLAERATSELTARILLTVVLGGMAGLAFIMFILATRFLALSMGGVVIISIGLSWLVASAGSTASIFLLGIGLAVFITGIGMFWVGMFQRYRAAVEALSERREP